ncbi:hypothetical protein FOCC_FOCC009086 [Frankliniella occidentalis]|uniref:P2R1A-PPP2R2A-interacting phosphatase regulator 1 n=1 Tax=Frankliniella occidentalis TaxID=133901 RepID=A0A6J1TEX5_FRAOC|nr:P2R1A-PPP2R2A-interacting phosphatase regulator 1 [Frankliniella occidentalis]KAE8744271.1 hypothetical protein FOCC_FOCC009086 [Frankliniella occidentalis]
MAGNMSSAMDVDPPASLKRSNSAPMINELNSNMAAATGAASPTAAAVRETSSLSIFQSTRTRRFSGSSFTSHSAGSSPRPSPRVSQLKKEECLDIARSEAAHEKEIHSAIQMSQSCEDLTLDLAGNLSCSDNESERKILGPREPLHLNLPPHSPVCSSPSPTRSGLNRQLFTPMGNSPTRKSYTTRRSQSPQMRASTLGPAVKRKFELDDAEQYRSPPTKRLSTGNGSGNGSGLLMAQHRLDQGSSPLPGSLSSVGTPDSLSSADSPNFTFRPLDSPSPGQAHTGPSDHSPS